jgi:PhnB protein
MQINPYLIFDGRCEEAFKFYEQALHGKIEAMMTHADAPPDQQGTPEWSNKIMHARMVVGGQVIMGSDAPPQHFARPQGFMISLNVKDTAEADRLFNALSQNGQVQMPIQKTFWSPRFGMCTDRFGIPWMVNCEGAAASAQ